MRSRPARGPRQGISGNNAVVVKKGECSHMATASSAARISGGCKVCNLELKRALPRLERLTSAPRGGGGPGTLCGDGPVCDRWGSLFLGGLEL